MLVIVQSHNEGVHRCVSPFPTRDPQIMFAVYRQDFFRFSYRICHRDDSSDKGRNHARVDNALGILLHNILCCMAEARTRA